MHKVTDFGFSAISIIVSLFIFVSHSSANEMELLACAKIVPDSERLNCYDHAAGGSDKVDANISESIVSVADILADFDELKGKQVKTGGFLLMMGQQGVLYAQRGDMTAVFVEVGKLPKSVRHDIFSNCGGGCDVKVTGKVTTEMMNPGLEAQSVTFD